MPPTRRAQVSRVRAEGSSFVCALEDDELAVEEPLELRIEGESLLVTMRTPGHDEELAAGLLYTEGLIDGADDLVAIAHIDDPRDPRGNTLDTRLAGGVRRGATNLLSSQRAMFASSACGICGGATVDRVLSRVGPLVAPRRASPDLLLSLAARMREAQATFAKTGGLHAAALFDLDGGLEVLREDIGRHNAVDKALGWRLLRDEVPVDDRVLLVSGRAGFELVQKALVARVPVMAAIGAPSSLAVELARAGGMQLVGFLRDGRFNDYSAPSP
ncbi:formate dehydrogenase accessory sulfurtransferase FdhD [Myxococcota bacterium]|nr:formate dehydrogenase accessory sulfurtransferase FdhD [Myxococcota bacterium]